MPYQIKGKCVCDESGKPIEGGCHKSRSEAMRHMKALYANVSEARSKKMENIQLSVAMKNPVWLGCAVTNRPHIRLKEHPLSIVEIDGKKFIRVPMMPAGNYRHPQGDLDMQGQVFDAFIQNHEKGIADFEVVLDAKHLPERGALGLFEKKYGGFVQREKTSKPMVGDSMGELLVSYAVPTGEDVIEIIESGKFRHASMEFHPDYKSNVKQTYLSSDDLEEIDMTIELGGLGSGRKGHLTSGFKKAYKAADKPFAAKRKVAKGAFGAAKKVFGAKRNLAKKGLKAYGKPFKAYGRATKSNFGKVKKSVGLEETIQLDSLIPLYENLSEYVEQGQDDEFFWFDPDLFDFSEAELPTEEGYYKVDKQTAEEMLDVLDELAQDEQFSHLFIEEESEENMPDETAQELQAKIAQLEAQLAESNERTIKLEKTSLESQVHALILELKNLKDGGYGYTAETLNMVQSLMLGESIGEGNEAITLEDTSNPADIATYYRRGMIKFLKSALVRAKVEGTTQPDETRVLEVAGLNGNEKFEAGKKDAQTFWSQAY